jgi:hypothetical protein
LCKDAILRPAVARACRPLLMVGRRSQRPWVHTQTGARDYDGTPMKEAAMSDKSILDHISALVAEEHQLTSQGKDAERDADRLRHIGEQLDQCWDLLRQRRALREFGQDPDDAKPRDIGTVEGYIG